MPERMRRTIRGLEKFMEPLRYHFDDLEKQVRRKPMGIDLVATMEIIHKNMARIEQELSFMRERVDMELLLRNDSLSDENLPLPRDTPPAEEDPAPDGEASSAPAQPKKPRAFSATGNPFDMPPTMDDRDTRTDERSSDETLFLKPVKLDKQSSEDKVLVPAKKNALRRDPSASQSRGTTRGRQPSGNTPTASEDDPPTSSHGNEDTVVLNKSRSESPD